MEINFSEHQMQIIIISLVGLLSGFASYLNSELLNNKEQLKQSEPLDHVRLIIQLCITGAVIAFISYSLLDLTDVSFIFKCGIASLASYLGLDKCIEIADKFTKFKR